GVVDGDTIEVRMTGSRRIATVHLIGIDAPETKRSGRVECGARQALSNLLQLTFTAPVDGDGDYFLDTSGGTGRRVMLTGDATQPPFGRRSRLRAYVRTVGGTQLQLDQLVR